MKVTCSICKDAFSPDSEVCAVECGHLFHKSCISEWCKTSLTCPHCRFKLKETPFIVNFEVKICTEKKLCETKCEELMQDLNVLREKEIELKLRYAGMEELLGNLRNEAFEAVNKAKKLKYDISVLQQECNYLEKTSVMIKDLENENEAMEQKINSLKSLEKVMRGTDSDMYDVLAGIPITSSQIEELSRFIQAMRQKLKSVQNKYKKQKFELINLIEAVEKTFSDMKTKKQNLEVADKSVQTDDVPVRKQKKQSKKAE